MIRLIGPENADMFNFQLNNNLDKGDCYQTQIQAGKVQISASTPVALCRGAYNYLRNTGQANISWSGTNLNIPDRLPEDYSEKTCSPYKYRYYFNVVTHGYSTPYWDWERWEKEIDWMAVHGINMPLLGGAYEAILIRVFEKLGLKKDEIESFFTGPAHFPWNRMGNITGVDGPVPDSFWSKQIKLNHLILDRLRKLSMHPIIQSFAGFVPEGITRIYPNVKLRNLRWGGFPKQYNAHILEPGSPLFIKIGGMFIKEWENEFGKAEFYLADCFNEMEVPLSENPDKALVELAQFGNSVYESIHKSNSNATWVMQGWTFPFQKDRKTGKLFWTSEKLRALISQVPDDKLMILDLANEYNLLFWKIQPSWKMYNGFFGKQWIYSFIPNMGGKTPWNGVLKTYATAPIEALNFKKKGKLVGFGFAPEGIENNEIIYELLSDMGWMKKAIELDKWIAAYCEDRYGGYPDEMKSAYKYFRKSCYGTFTDHPRFKFQFGTRNPSMSGISVHRSSEFVSGLDAFLECNTILGQNKLYQDDAIEVSTQYLGLKVDDLLTTYENNEEKDTTILNEAFSLLTAIDRLLASHPCHRLRDWIESARNFGDNQKEKNYYESNAKQLITIWGDEGEITDYAARMWSGLIGTYYLPRLKLSYRAKRENRKFDLLKWEQNWVNTPWKPEVTPYENPIAEAVKLVHKYEKTPLLENNTN